jgi:hypothetical protein
LRGSSAPRHIDNTAGDSAAALKALGGAGVILATAPGGDAMSAVVQGLGRNGKLIIVGVSVYPVQVPTVQMIMNRASVQGWPSGTAQDSTETLAFSALANVRPMIEEYPLERAVEAYDHMMSAHRLFDAPACLSCSPHTQERCGPPGAPGIGVRSRRLCVRVRAHHLDADEGLIALHPGVVPRRDGVRLAGADRLLGAVLHVDLDAPRHRIAHVRYLAEVGLDYRLDAFRPAPAGLKIESPDREVFVLTNFHARFVR